MLGRIVSGDIIEPQLSMAVGAPEEGVIVFSDYSRMTLSNTNLLEMQAALLFQFKFDFHWLLDCFGSFQLCKRMTKDAVLRRAPRVKIITPFDTLARFIKYKTRIATAFNLEKLFRTHRILDQFFN